MKHITFLRFKVWYLYILFDFARLIPDYAHDSISSYSWKQEMKNK